MLAALGLLGLVVLLLALRQPLFVVVMATAAYCYAVWAGDPIRYVAYDMWMAVNQEVLLSIPLFMLAGAIMAKGAISRRIVTVMRELTRPVPGGLALATVLSCALFAAVSGSSVVTMLAVGAVLYPALVADGYKRSFAIGALAAGGTLGVIIPPSILLILYGVITETSIADLFLAGIGPGLLLTAIFATYAVVMHWNRPRERFDARALGRSLVEGGPSLLMPFIILGGIYSGILTPTEAAAAAVIYAITVELAIHREMDLKGLLQVVTETSILIGQLFIVLALAVSINTFLTYEEVPTKMVEALGGILTSKIAFLLAANLLLIAAGALMDEGSAVLIFAPILTPLAVSFGIDPVHWGIIMIVNLQMGYLTPPVGLNVIVAMTAFKEPFWFITKSVVPWIAMLLLGLVITIAVPELSLFPLGR